MPNAKETVRALINAFNVHNYARDTVETNFTLQSNGKRSYILVSFDKGMNDYQCSRYLNSIKRKIIREFYGIEEGNDKEILDAAKLIFDINSFPFDIKGEWSREQGRVEFVTPIDHGVIFNLKSHLASSLEKDVLEDMRISSTTVPFNKEKYLCCSKFPDKESREKFKSKFLSRLENRYGYRKVFKNPLKVEGNDVYIRDVFNDACFIDSVTRYITWLTGMGFHADSKVRSDVKAFKDSIMRFIDQSTGIMLAGFICASPLAREEASILVPVVLDGGRKRILTNEEALKLNYAFNGAVFNDLDGKTQGELSINGSSGIYSIDFSNPEVSHCVINKIIESSVINEKHELAIDPELHLRSLSPELLSLPISPTHSGVDSRYYTHGLPNKCLGSDGESPGSSPERPQTQLDSLSGSSQSRRSMSAAALDTSESTLERSGSHKGSWGKRLGKAIVFPFVKGNPASPTHDPGLQPQLLQPKNPFLPTLPSMHRDSGYNTCPNKQGPSGGTYSSSSPRDGTYTFTKGTAHSREEPSAILTEIKPLSQEKVLISSGKS